MLWSLYRYNAGEGKNIAKKIKKITFFWERQHILLVWVYLPIYESSSNTTIDNYNIEIQNYIKNYEYKNPELRSFILSLINDNGVDPSLVAYYFSIIKDKADFWEDDKEYILRLINTPWF